MSLTAQGQLQSTVKVGKRALGNLTLEETAIKNPDDLDAYFSAFPEQQPFRNLAGALDVKKRDTRMHRRRQLLNPKFVLGLGLLNPKLGEITITIPILPSLLSELLPAPTTSLPQLPSVTVVPTLTSVVASVVSSLVPSITVSSAPVPTGTALTGRQRNEYVFPSGALFLRATADGASHTQDVLVARRPCGRKVELHVENLEPSGFLDLWPLQSRVA